MFIKMKHQFINRMFLLVILMVASISQTKAMEQGEGGPIKVEASETVELISILSRTAEFQEYCMDMGGKYTEETEKWFTIPTPDKVEQLEKENESMISDVIGAAP